MENSGQLLSSTNKGCDSERQLYTFCCCYLQEKEFLCRISDLQDELRHRDHHIAELDKEILHLHDNISALTKELEFKGKEVLRIRSESNQQIRYDFFHSKLKRVLSLSNVLLSVRHITICGF